VNQVNCEKCEQLITYGPEQRGTVYECNICSHTQRLPGLHGRVFISHQSEDREFIEQQIIPIFKRHGIETWYSRENIQTRENWQTSILMGLRSSNGLVVVISRNSARSSWVRAEVEWALKNRKEFLCPVLIEKAESYQTHLLLGLIQHVDFTSDFDIARRKLVETWGVEYCDTECTVGAQVRTDLDLLELWKNAGRNPWDFINNCWERRLELWRSAAVAEMPAGQYLLGRCYHEGHGVEQDYLEAIRWFEKAAREGLSSAQCHLGYCYAVGDGVERDEQKSNYWYEEAVKQGHANAQYYRAMDFEYGRGVERNVSEALKLFELAARQGHAEAQYRLGVHLAGGDGGNKNPERAVQWLREASEQGLAPAQCYLGKYYLDEEKNESEATRWLRRAADQGNTRAQTLLAECYLNGRGVERNSMKAIFWYREAANRGDQNAEKILMLFPP
jgi:TPR repeat protein